MGSQRREGNSHYFFHVINAIHFPRTLEHSEIPINHESDLFFLNLYLSISLSPSLCLSPVREQRVPIVAQWKQTELVSMRMRVQSLTSLSGLRIWCCHELWCRLQMQIGSHVAVAGSCSSDSTPRAWALPYATPAALKKKGKKKKKRE